MSNTLGVRDKTGTVVFTCRSGDLPALDDLVERYGDPLDVIDVTDGGAHRFGIVVEWDYDRTRARTVVAPQTPDAPIVEVDPRIDRVPTSQLRQGDVVRVHGMRVLIDGPIQTKDYSVSGLPVYWQRGLVLNLEEVIRSGVVPPSFVGEGRWTIQGNDLARWYIEDRDDTRAMRDRAIDRVADELESIDPDLAGLVAAAEGMEGIAPTLQEAPSRDEMENADSHLTYARRDLQEALDDLQEARKWAAGDAKFCEMVEAAEAYLQTAIDAIERMGVTS